MSILNLFMRRIPPSSPASVYCAKCGCAVNPGGWDCPRCGVSLHEPGATTTVPPSLPGLAPADFPATPARSKPAVSRASVVVFIVLALVVIGYILSSSPAQHNPGESYPPQSFLSAIGSTHGFLLWIGLIVGVPAVLWVFGAFDR